MTVKLVSLTGRKYAPTSLDEGLVTWTEIAGGLAVLAMLAVGLGIILSAFLLATVGVGQLELRAILLFKNWWASGPLIALVAVLAFRRRQWLRLRRKQAGLGESLI
ncbi:hypothetical protein GGH91_006120 [Coemansia sp. RSA 2671]|uniref:Uncharacterized protein n=1 Tax=Coemansia linderi TaxID=2663919 RepID=A0ACC1K7C4_9FUNG|nr:hypothetical protein LPJ60_002608 [Coemansia sp. RSA 2675]KAJ2014458.1 hypothetical protein GGI06_003551 [Coemansia sp. S85]KAJ2332660.1 hypothetical protein GGH91_006120 [Coemansia sp. RSA 2671]KAJ2414428.1 hypothetical protein GGI10_002392 [Coemansia sp. RSA 2530]KAJ2774970.1 hypothetical protein GGI18_004518 [Coemansia linderi]